MGNILGFGGNSGVRISIKNDEGTRTFDNIDIGKPEDKIFKDILSELNGSNAEIIMFELIQPDTKPYMPSEEKLIKMLEAMNSSRPKKSSVGFIDGGAATRTNIYSMVLNVTFEEKSKEIASRLLFFHIALVMNALNLKCNTDGLSLMGSLKDYRAQFMKINELTEILK